MTADTVAYQVRVKLGGWEGGEGGDEQIIRCNLSSQFTRDQRDTLGGQVSRWEMRVHLFSPDGVFPGV